MWADILDSFMFVDGAIIVIICIGFIFNEDNNIGFFGGLIISVIVGLGLSLIVDIFWLVCMLINGSFKGCESRCNEVPVLYRYECERYCKGLDNHSHFDGNSWYKHTIEEEHDRIEDSVRDLWEMDNGACQYLGDCHAVCSIKGNISIDNGEKIYHMPGCSHYKDTVINRDYGERYFCTEEEAQRYGWRKCIDF